MTEYKLTKYEKETIITFNDAENKAECYTCNQSWMKRLDGFCEKSQEISLKKEDAYSKTYTFPKKWVRVQISPTYSNEQRAKMAERAKELNLSRKNYTSNANAETDGKE